MTLVTEAVIFASQKHDGMLRKGTDTPYIVHPMEAVAIAAALTSDEDILCACALHDVAEDCGVTESELAEEQSDEEQNISEENTLTEPKM